MGDPGRRLLLSRKKSGLSSPGFLQAYQLVLAMADGRHVLRMRYCKTP